MQNYVNKDLARLHHPLPIKPQRSPHPYNDPIYGQKHQFFIPTIPNEKLTPAQLKHCQELCCFFNYYDRAIDDTMQTSFSDIASSLSTSSWEDLKFLDYAAIRPNAKIRYHSIQMHLWIHSDASYLNESKSRFRNGGFFGLSDKPKIPIKPNDTPPKINAPVLFNSKTIDTVVSSVQ